MYITYTSTLQSYKPIHLLVVEIFALQGVQQHLVMVEDAPVYEHLPNRTVVIRMPHSMAITLRESALLPGPVI